MNVQPRSTVIASIGKLDISVKDLRSLKPRKWLTGAIITAYATLLMADAATEKRKFLLMNTFFWNKLTDNGYNFNAMKLGWLSNAATTDRAKFPVLTMYGKVFIPWNAYRSHWSVLVINLDEEKFEFYDSGIEGIITSEATVDRTLACLAKYTVDEAERSGVVLDVSKWRRCTPTMLKCPQQTNGYDCGAFMCMVLLHVMHDVPLAFSQACMLEVRRHIASRILGVASA
jgi:sentrin-specific protease 1